MTVSSIKPVPHVLKRNVLAEAGSDTHLTESHILQEKYSDGEIEELLNVSGFLDPHFISNYIISDTKVTVVKDRLVCEGSVFGRRVNSAK